MKKSHKLAVAVLVGATMLGALLVAKTSDQRASGLRMGEAARAFLKTLDDEQRAQATFRYDDPERFNWHYIPRVRKGVPLKSLNPMARAAAHGLIASGLSERGYQQVVNVMSLEDVLFLLEKGDWTERRLRRDPLNYSLTLFGTPSDQGVWGWRLEGHHLSLNYTVKDGHVVASTPEFFGANPALVDAGPGRSIRVLAPVEDLAREIVRTCTPDQMKTVIVSSQAPNDVWNANRRQSELSPAVGVAAADMTRDQRTLFKQLLGEYLKNMPADVRAQREARIEAGGFDKIRLAWWGSLERNEKHAYRLQGPTFLIEYNNTQNNANHVHSVWRNTEGDFDQPIGRG
ncbi:MAG TPA: DUF3500 domain-containing protein [Planctomycetaceae bacterium]|jgi:hypothetical protein|nr:DUF3500 domain-containing protein [Planctomycetaceae bacterium]